MPPRYAYWTILAGGLPTAFRAADREELLPTFKRIQEKHPDAEMKYFARGQLWESRDAAQAALIRRRQAVPSDSARRAGSQREGRGRDWRPGGEHRDPRQRFKDAKKERNLEWRNARFARKNRPPREKPHGDPLRPEIPPATATRPETPVRKGAPKRPTQRPFRPHRKAPPRSR